MDFNEIVKDGKCRFEVVFDDGQGFYTINVCVQGVRNIKDVDESWKSVLSYAINLSGYAGFRLVAIGLLPVEEWEDR